MFTILTKRFTMGTQQPTSIYSALKGIKNTHSCPIAFGSIFKILCIQKGTKTDFKEKMYRFLTYCDTEKDVNDFWKEYIGNIKPFYLKQKKDDDVIISASPEFLLKPVCKRLKIKTLWHQR